MDQNELCSYTQILVFYNIPHLATTLTFSKISPTTPTDPRFLQSPTPTSHRFLQSLPLPHVLVFHNSPPTIPTDPRFLQPPAPTPSPQVLVLSRPTPLLPRSSSSTGTRRRSKRCRGSGLARPCPTRGRTPPPSPPCSPSSRLSFWRGTPTPSSSRS